MENCESQELGNLLLRQSIEAEKNQRVQENCVKALFQWWNLHQPVDKTPDSLEVNQELVNLLVQLPNFMRSKSTIVKS